VSTTLCPAQQHALDRLRHVLTLGNVFALRSDTGLGRTTVLRELHTQLGGAFLNMADYMAALQTSDPVALEETFERLIFDALRAHPAVVVDDLHLLACVVGGCNHFYQRKGLLDMPLTTLATFAAEAGKKLIFGCDESVPDPVRSGAISPSSGRSSPPTTSSCAGRTSARKRRGGWTTARSTASPAS
jgi:hypothetical protein